MTLSPLTTESLSVIHADGEFVFLKFLKLMNYLWEKKNHLLPNVNVLVGL